MVEDEGLCFNDDLFMIPETNGWKEDVLTNPNSKYLRGKLTKRGLFVIEENIKNYSIFARTRIYQGEVGGSPWLGDEELIFNEELLSIGFLNIFKSPKEDFHEEIFHVRKDTEEFNKENPLEYLIFRGAKDWEGKLVRVSRILEGYNQARKDRRRLINNMYEMGTHIREEHSPRFY